MSKFYVIICVMNFQSVFILYIMCELFELFYVQKGNSLNSYLSHMFSLYKRGIVSFLCMHPSFYVVLFAVATYENYGFLAAILIALKSLDIVLKIVILQKIENAQPLGIFQDMLQENMEISYPLKVGVCLFYVVIFYVAFFSYS